MAGHFTKRWLVGMLLVLGGVVVQGGPVAAQEVLRLAQNIAGDSKPILLYADEISTWVEDPRRIVLMKGTVLAEQGVVHTRMQGGVAWVDLDRKRQSGLLHVDLYAEGDVHLESGAASRGGPKAILDLTTRGELKIRSQRTKVVEQPRPTDPLYRRALAEMGAIVPSAPGSVVPVSGSAPAVPPPAPGTKTAPTIPVPPPSFQIPPPVGGSPPPAAPSSGKSAESPVPPTLQRTAAVETVASGSAVIPAQWPPPRGDPLPAGAAPSTPASPPPGVYPPPPAGGQVMPVVPAPSTPPVPPGVPAPIPPSGSAPGPPPRPAPPTANPPVRQLRIESRTSTRFQTQFSRLPNGEQALFITGGAILTIQGANGGPGLVDIEADQVVVWSRRNLQDLFGGLRSAEGQNTREGEFYLAGNVEIRSQNGPESRTLRADEVYYDVGRNVAVARNADIEFQQKGIPDPVHLRADEILQLSATQFKGYRAEIFASRLPSDPGLKLYVKEATLENKVVPKRSIFGQQYVNRATGQPETETERLIHGNNIFLELENIPVFYLPFVQGDANDPLGPLTGINFNYDRIFGFQVFTTFNVYDLIGIDPIPGTSWKIDLDYLSQRGPALGTTFDYAGKNLFDLPGKYVGQIKAYGINDTGTDILGGGRGENEPHPEQRGRFFWRHHQELPDDFTLQFQVSALSDKNFLEQYYKNEFDREYNQETFVYLKQQRDNWAWTFLTEPNIRNWVTETQWLPRVDGHLIGESLFDRLTYNAHASAGYAILHPTHRPPPPFEVTDQSDDTTRLDLFQELSYPFYLGPVRVAPYGVLDLTYYSEDLTGSDRARVYEAGGIRASMPLTRLYPDIQSQLFNLNGINHKIVLSTNYYIAHSDTALTRLPQLDRINDDATDQALRDIKPREPDLNPAHGALLANSPLFDPQLYALRRLVDNRIDTLDSIEVLEVDARQRWQTKRGYPGMQHIVDWMTLDLSGSYFPDSKRDNFGNNFAFLQYDWLWNIGDRTALVSTGWFDPIADGPRVFTIGAYLNRPDRTNFYLGYRQIDPLSSRAVTGSITYVFSPKYAMTANTTYDFGTSQSQSNSLVFTRMGSDLQVSFGVNYNSILNNFGVTFEIFPNLVPENRRNPGVAALGSSLLAGPH